jgi:hypothetical protein
VSTFAARLHGWPNRELTVFHEVEPKSPGAIGPGGGIVWPKSTYFISFASLLLMAHCQVSSIETSRRS